MSFRHRLSLLAAFAVAVTAFAASSSGASAAGNLAGGAVGSDISWPQCGGPGPSDPYSFGVVGVTGGAPFSGNDCLDAEMVWAIHTGTTHLYINLDFGQRKDGPLTCGDGDVGCQAYNYGYDSANWAVTYAHQKTNGLSDGVPVWWLDVETENVWSDNPDQNSYVIQGALDFFQRHYNHIVGIYSTSYQWSEIAGNFAPPNVPNWVAGSGELYDWGQCSASLWPGGQVWMIQYLNNDLDLDQNLAC